MFVVHIGLVPPKCTPKKKTTKKTMHSKSTYHMHSVCKNERPLQARFVRHHHHRVPLHAATPVPSRSHTENIKLIDLLVFTTKESIRPHTRHCDVRDEDAVCGIHMRLEKSESGALGRQSGEWRNSLDEFNGFSSGFMSKSVVKIYLFIYLFVCLLVFWHNRLGLADLLFM